MKTEKKLGIWMDNSSAHVMELTADDIETNIVASAFTNEEREQALGRSEHIMHNKERQQQSVYYKNLGDIIAGYDDVILFGPTNAKLELFNGLKKDQRFRNIKLGVLSTDKMTEHQEHAFVKDYFDNKHEATLQQFNESVY